jgi:hypothetical protein
MVAPTILYRVEDEDSRARYLSGKGILAEDTETRVDFRRPNQQLRDELENHVDWSNRVPTVLISTYSEKNVASREAERRVREGKKNVVVYTIDSREKDRPMEYREMRRLMKKLGLKIPYYAWNNSKYEFVVLYNVPESAVLYWEEYW